MAEMTILVVQLVVEFAKSLPGFASQHKEDQITLLKVGSSFSHVVSLSTHHASFHLPSKDILQATYV
jgi:hypothetical protein